MNSIYWDTTIRQIDYACSAALYEYFVILLSQECIGNNCEDIPVITDLDIGDDQEVVEAIHVSDGDMEYQLCMLLDMESDEVVGIRFVAAFKRDVGKDETPMILARNKHGEYAGFATNMDLYKATELVMALCKRYINTVNVFTNNTYVQNI